MLIFLIIYFAGIITGAIFACVIFIARDDRNNNNDGGALNE